MKLIKILLSVYIMLVIFSPPVHAQHSTEVTVRALAKDAKFIGDGMGGAMITIRNAATGDTLAQGLAKGGTGDTERLVKQPAGRYDTLSTPDAAAFEANLMLKKPTLVTITATAPMGEPQAKVTASTQQWLIPGKDIIGDGIIIEIPGFAITNELPKANKAYQTGKPMTIRSHIVMMCGCPTSDGGLWDSTEYEIMALISRDGKEVDEFPLSFTGKTNLFEAQFIPQETGDYQITVYSFHPETSNAGVARTEVRVAK